jgi:hypothetical protein
VKPTIGRIVHYYPPAYMASSLGVGPLPGHVMVTGDDGRLDLLVPYCPLGICIPLWQIWRGVPEGQPDPERPHDGHWVWPPREGKP